MKNKPLISALEPRLLFDGAAVATAVEVLDNTNFENNSADTNDTPPASESQLNNKKEVAFIDSNVKDKQILIDSLDENIDVYIIDNESNGFDQIAEILKDKNGIDAIHILSHGSEGQITLGNSVINSESLNTLNDTLSNIGSSLTQNGDILLYGCNVSENGNGKDFVNKLAELTNADVAASDDITGAQSLGGDWDLEYSNGLIDTENINIKSYNKTFAPVQISVFSYPNLNGSDSNPGSGTENANLASIVQDNINKGGNYTLDTSIQNFTDSDLASKLDNSGFFFMTDMEGGNPLDQSFLPDASKTIIKDWVSDGGVIMMTGTYGSNDTNFLNTIFGWDLTTQGGSSWNLDTANAAGTPFEGGPASLSNLSATDSIGKGTVDNFTAIYGTDSNATIATIGYGSGTVIFLGFDFYSTGIAGTGFTSSAPQYGADVTTGSASTSDWVTKIIPNALEYSASLSGSETILEDTTYTFTSDAFKSNTGTYTQTQITSLPSSDLGVLKLSGTAVTLNQVIASSDYVNLTFSPVSDKSGTASFTFKGYESGSYGADTNFEIKITAVNDTPEFTIGSNQTVDEDAGAQSVSNFITSIDEGGGSDEDSQSLTFTTTNDNNSLFSTQPTISSNGTLSYTSAINQSGTATVTVKLADDGGTADGATDFVTKTFTITVNAVDDAPIVTSTNVKTIVDTANADVFGEISDSLTVTDPENQSLTYSIDNAGSNVTTLAGTYGSLTIDASTGAYKYSPNSGDINALDTNASDVFTLKVTDGTNIVSTSLTINITAVADNVAQYNEQSSPIKILENMNVGVDSSINYSGGYIDFDLSNSESTETLNLEKVDTANIINGAISIVGNSVYLGNGTTASIIGSVDSTKNGQNGNPLRINFTVGFNNGDMESNTVGVETNTVGETVSIPGWKIVNDRVILGQDTIDGLATPTDPTYPQPNADRGLNDSGYGNLRTLETSTVDDSGNKVLKFNSRLTSDGYGVLRGPYVYSDGAVNLEAGDSVSFTWKAEGGSDAYDVFGYIVDVNDPSKYDIILNETGSSGRATTPWATKTTTVSADGEYQFVFIAGSYDFSGGRALGAQLFVDNVSVTQANPPSGVNGDALEKLSRLVTYENSSDLSQSNSTVDKTLTVSIVQKDNTSVSTNQKLEIQEINDAPTVATLTPINYTDTSANDDFTNQTGTAVGSDVDSGSTLVYGITGGTDNGTTVTKTSDLGTLTITKSTGAYTFEPNDAAINALLVDTSETFAITATDDAGATGSNNLAINISAANDVLVATPASETIVDTANTDVFGEISDSLTVTDPENQSLTYSIDNAGSNVTTLAGTYGSLTIDASTGAYKYSPNSGDINALDTNASDVFTLKVTDGTNIVSTSLTINITAVADNVAQYNEQSSPIKILENMNVGVDSSINYSGGYIDFDLSNSESTETLNLEKVDTANIINGAISIVGNSVYLGNGTTASIIGSVDSTKNGQNGNPLRINFTVGFNNGDMESNTVGVETNTVGETVSIPGWKIVNDRVILGQDTIDGLATPTDPTYPQPNADRGLNDSGYGNLRTLETSTVDDSGNKVLKFNSRLTSDGYGVLRGPYVYSDGAVNLEAGDSVSFTWKAEGGSDAYDVFGYIVDVNDPSKYDIILNETGSSGRATTPWATKTTTVSADGEYQFVFIAGSYDFSGGRALGAQLFVDNVSVTQANPPSGVNGDALEKLSRLVTYENSSDLSQSNSTVDKTLTVSIVQKDNTSVSTNQKLEIQEINDAPTVATLTPINYTDTSANDDFTNQTGTAVGSDVDSGSTLVYGITGGTDNGTTVTKVSDMGTLTIDKSTGVYTFEPNDSAINALLVDASETFAITATDDTGATGSNNLAINISAANDIPEIQIVDVEGSITEGSILTDSGSITFTDVDLTDRPTATESTKNVSAVLRDGSTPLVLSSQQQADIEAAFTITNVDANDNNGSVNWNYSINEAKLDFLAQGEVVTAVFTITVTDDNGATATENVTVTITGENDVPTVSNENIDVILSFGEDYNRDVSSLFNDLDLTDVHTYEINNLPKGIVYNPNTGIISGEGLEAGKFNIEVIISDNANPAGTISRTFEIIVLSPPEVDIPAPEVDATFDAPIEVGNVDVNVFEGDSVEGVLNTDSNEGDNSGSTGDGFVSNNVTPEPIISTTTDIVQDVQISSSPNGEVQFSPETVESFAVLGLSIEDMSISGTFVEIKITDIKVGQQYEVTLSNGNPLPEGLTFDSATGEIKGQYEGELELTIKAVSSDGSSRILNLKIDLNNDEQSTIENRNEENSAHNFIGLKEQLAMQNQVMESYGDNVSSLFSS
ncbi:DUF4347 domain-containing protein [Poseidonibacter lekithochrous]|uniref:DUF4347 domain-containing protein n=1 Tax=Poseidonibacter lekithochrous TaxID=1904463 RepID=UPI0008FCD9AA|nr:DUF4347 domain-containing protein [Poseidonibacter lekithochrous]QKJ21501.1 DUF4347 domain-containing protein (VCBS repeat domains) [Poseidonibacter lekithochrous]